MLLVDITVWKIYSIFAEFKKYELFISDVTGLGRTRQKPDLDYYFQTETQTWLLRRNPEKPEPDCETRQNPKGFCKD